MARVRQQLPNVDKKMLQIFYFDMVTFEFYGPLIWIDTKVISC